MKKILSLILAALLITGVTAFAEDSAALDAFNALTNQQIRMGNPDKSNAEYLAEIMDGVYASQPADYVTAFDMAAELPYLTGITNRDIAAFASANRYSVAQVRNAYYIALANVLRAEILVNPASEEQYRHMQLILSLFLEADEAHIDHASREVIRSSMNHESAAIIASGYNLPVSFVEFLIMDDDWEDDLWENDDDWREEIDWDDDLFEDMDITVTLGDRDKPGSSLIADLQERLIALGYLTGKADGVFGPATQTALFQYQLANGKPVGGRFDADDLEDMFDGDAVARWDYEDSFDYDDSPDFNDSPDYDNSPDYADSFDYNNSPDYADSFNYDNSPDYADSFDYDNSPDYADSFDYDNSFDYDDSPDYEDS